MEFKRLAAILLCCAAMFTASICFASVRDRDVAIDDIFIGMSESDVVYYIGHPDSYDGDKWIYSDMHVYIHHDRVTRISTHSHNLYTPAGVSCGMSVDRVEDIYGRPDQIKRDSESVEYKYYSRSGRSKLEFLINRSGTVSKIICKEN